MHYFIDGYNLMFRTLHASDDLQTQRWRIIHDLNEKIQILNLDVTLVFDSHYQFGEATRTHFNKLEIQFTEQGETADEFILEELKHEQTPQMQTVVTSDKTLAWLSRRSAAKTETVEEFLGWLNKRYKNKRRQLKTSKQAGSEKAAYIKKEQIPAIPQKTVKPSKNASPEECFDYYLSLFTENFNQIAVFEPPLSITPPTKQPPKKSRVKKAKKIAAMEGNEGLSLEERWLKAFERDIKDDINSSMHESLE